MSTETRAQEGEPTPHGAEAKRHVAVRGVLVFTLGLNLAVAAAKILYGHGAGLLAIEADGFHSLTDGLNNVVALIGIWIAARPPDRDHPYGHRKFEFFAAGLIGLSLLAMAVGVLEEAYARSTGEAELPEVSWSAFVVLGVTWVVNLAVATYQTRAGRRLKSPILLSDAAHTRSDVFVTVGVAAAALATRVGVPFADVVAAGLVAAFIAWAGLKVLRDNLAYLADAAFVDAKAVEALARGVTGVRSAHRVRSRGGPGHIFVDLHIGVAPELTVGETHRITHDVMRAIMDGLEGVVDVTIHAEPDPDGVDGAAHDHHAH